MGEKNSIVDGNGRKLYPVSGKNYVVDGDGRKLYPTTASGEVYGSKGIDLKDYAKKSDLKAYAKKSDLPDLSNYAKKSDIPDMSEYAKKSEVQEEVDDAVDQAIQNLDIEKYIDEDELAQKIGELALEDYAKKSDLDDLNTAVFDGTDQERSILDRLNHFPTEGDGTFEDELQSAFQDVTDFVDDVQANYAKKSDLNDLNEAVFEGSSEKRSILDRLDNVLTDSEGSYTIEQAVEAARDTLLAHEEKFEDVENTFNLMGLAIGEIGTKADKALNEKLDIDDSYDLELKPWFEGTTGVSPESQEADPFANPVRTYILQGHDIHGYSYMPAANSYMFDYNSGEWVKVNDDDNRSFTIHLTVDDHQLTAEIYNGSGLSGAEYWAKIDWSDVADTSVWLDTLDLHIDTIADKYIGDEGATTTVSKVFQKAVDIATVDLDERVKALEEASPVTGDFLKIDDSYDLEITEWFHGETGQKTQVGDTAEYRYTFAPNFELPRNVFVRNLNFTDWDNVVQLKDEGPRIFVLEYKDSEDNLHDMTFVPTGDQWFASLNFDEKPELAPETLELNIVALVNPGQEAGEYATINVKDKFYGAVHYALVQELAYLLRNADNTNEAIDNIINRLETLNSKIAKALLRSESYEATRRLLFTSHAGRLDNGNYKLWIYDSAPLAEGTCVGSTNADGSLRNLIMYRDGKIEDLELWYDKGNGGEYNTVTLYYRTDGDTEWFEFDAGIESNPPEMLSIRDVYAIELVSVADEFYAAVASLVGEPLINMDTRISSLDNNLSGVYTRLGGVENRLNNFLDSGESIEDEIQGMADTLDDVDTYVSRVEENLGDLQDEVRDKLDKDESYTTAEEEFFDSEDLYEVDYILNNCPLEDGYRVLDITNDLGTLANDLTRCIDRSGFYFNVSNAMRDLHSGPGYKLSGLSKIERKNFENPT